MWVVWDEDWPKRSSMMCGEQLTKDSTTFRTCTISSILQRCSTCTDASSDIFDNLENME